MLLLKELSQDKEYICERKTVRRCKKTRKKIESF